MPAIDLSDFDVASEVHSLNDRDLILELEERGFTVTKDTPQQRQIQLTDRPEGRVRFAIVSDTHLGHRKQQLTHLTNFYEVAREWGAEFMLHGGDVVDGQNMH